MIKNARAIAFYLPQYHPVPENDLWHGKGFTEWTNVTKAKPLFRGHYQPILPADLGFYDLRVPETRIEQARLAAEYGVEAFCYWHYWFGNGRRILERPFAEVLKTGQPQFPFCLAWANASWTGTWYGMPDNVLLEQTYPGEEDYRAHFYSLLDAFSDKRYLTVNGKRLFLVFNPRELKPSAGVFTGLWQELARKEGIEGFHFIGATFTEEEPVSDGFAGSVQLAPFECLPAGTEMGNPDGPRINPYQDLVDYLQQRRFWQNEYPLVMPNWDNTARCGLRGSVLHESSPTLFKRMLQNALTRLDLCTDPENRLLFIQSWNEWAEGNYLEPDQWYGRAYLEAIRECILNT